MTTQNWTDCSNREYDARITDNIVAERDRLIEMNAELTTALDRIANGRPDRLNCSQYELWEVMRNIARAAIAKAKGE